MDLLREATILQSKRSITAGRMIGGESDDDLMGVSSDALKTRVKHLESVITSLQDVTDSQRNLLQANLSKDDTIGVCVVRIASIL
jgi:hypothetical protein